METLNEMLAITLQNCISLLGFIPDEHGNWVKDILYLEGFPPEKMALGCCLDQCMAAKSYKPLNVFKKSLDSRVP